MDVLGKLIIDTLEREFTVPKLLALTLSKRLAKLGFLPNRENLKQLESQFERQLSLMNDGPEHQSETFYLELAEEWFANGVQPAPADLEALQSTIDELPEVENLIDKLSEDA